MRYLVKKDVLYFISFSVFSLFYGFLKGGESVYIYYAYVYDLQEFDLLVLVFQCIWILPKLLAIYYILQNFIDAYENCYVYFKIRDENNMLWLKHILKNTIIKLLLLCLGKAGLVYLMLSEYEASYILFEFCYLLFFCILYVLCYLVLKDAKSIVAVTVVHLMIYITLPYSGVNIMNNIAFMNNVSVYGFIICLFAFVSMLIMCKYLLSKVSEK